MISKLFISSLPVWLAAIFPLLSSVGSATADESEIADEDIVFAIENELFNAKAVDANAIDVTSDQGIVKLSGTVKSLLARDRAIRLARMTKGVVVVIDQIEISPRRIPDSQIGVDVKKALASDPATDAWEIDVQVNDGEVTLRGTVESGRVNFFL